MNRFPKLRQIQYFPVTIEGKRYCCLHDPFKFSNTPLLIPWKLVRLLPYIDGKHSTTDIQAELNKQSGELIYHEELIEFINQLDHYLFLDSERFHEFESKVRDAFLSLSIRPAFFSGSSYASDIRILNEEFSRLFKFHSSSLLPQKNNEKISAIIAPHINIKSGGACYALGYKKIAHSAIIPELFIIIGTCHTRIKNLFTLTKKDFQTPFGLVKTDKAFINSLQENCKFDLFLDEFSHRAEHSIEFQILFLQFLWEKYGSEWPPLKICPILCGFTPDDLSQNPSYAENFHIFIDALKNQILSNNKDICLIISANLSHLGEKFGDTKTIDHSEINNPFNFDKRIIDLILKNDKEGFHNYIIRSFKNKRIYGYPPLITFLHLTSHNHGQLLNYDYSSVDNQGSIISYASIAFYELI